MQFQRTALVGKQTQRRLLLFAGGSHFGVCRPHTLTFDLFLGRQVDEGVWDSSSNLLSQSPKKVEPESDFSRGLDFEVPTSPPMNLHDLTASTDSLGTSSYGQSQMQSHLSKGSNPSRGSEMVAAKTQTGSETPSKRSVDRSVSMEVRAVYDDEAEEKQGP